MAAPAHTPDVAAGHDPDAHREFTYVIVALILAVMTAIEVALSYASSLKDAVAPLLLILMALKFATVTAYFMHLKFDKKALTVTFYAGLALAILVYLAILTIFRFWTPADHMVPH
jgi:heme/copper-type cytochrome/quinol oxidase subunit 4